jgi:hypothetical protein
MMTTPEARPLATERNGRNRSTVSRAVVSAVLAFVLLVGLAGSVPATTLRASPLKAPAAVQMATDYIPSAADLSGAFHEQTTIDVGGLLEPGTSVLRIFATPDGAQTLGVEVTIGQSPVDAQQRLDARVNQLVRYHGGVVGVVEGLGERAYRATTIGAEGQLNQMLIFRVNAISSEVALSSAVADPSLVDSVARFVEARMHADADAVTFVPGFSATPRSFPGTEPPGPPIAADLGPGMTITGDTSGGNDTVVQLTLLGLDRPWIGNTGPRPPVGFNYLTLNVLIETRGQTPANIVLEDFSATTLDGRSWPPILAREPGLRASQAVPLLPAEGWLTFAIPLDQAATQLVWRIRSPQTLGTGTVGDKTLTVPLTVGASQNTTIGTPAPPAAIPAQTPASIPPGSSPGSPSSPGAPSAPSSPSSPNSPSTPSGPGSGGGGRPRLQ